MGCLLSKEDREALARSRAIDKSLRASNNEVKRESKLLLLGAGESGKSTIMKQMQIIHSHGFTLEERTRYRAVIYNNTAQSMRSIVRAMGDLYIGFESGKRTEDARILFSCDQDLDEGRMSSEVSGALGRLWADGGVQECFRRYREYQLNDSTAYYFGALERISAPNYIPTEQDVLRSRLKTRSIIEARFEYKHMKFSLFDVGGQRTERKKWISCFEDVTAILFVVAMSEFDLGLVEEHSKNRMTESMELFNCICNNTWFKKTSMLLFLNKRDLFTEKIRQSPLSICFPEYTGANTYEETTLYIQHKFESLNMQKSTKQIFSHVTCATETTDIQFVFESVTDVIIRENLMRENLY